MTTTLKTGDRVSHSKDGAGTIIRINYPVDVIVVLPDKGDGNNSGPCGEDKEAAKSIGIELAPTQKLRYALAPDFTPIIDAKTPVGTKVKMGSVVGVLVHHDNDSVPLCWVPAGSRGANIGLGAIREGSLDGSRYADSAAKLGLGSNDTYAFCNYSALDFVSSPEPIKPAKPKPTRYVSKDTPPGTKVIIGGRKGIFICAHATSDGWSVIANLDGTGRHLSEQAHRDTAIALGMNPDSTTYATFGSKAVMIDEGLEDEDDEEDEDAVADTPKPTTTIGDFKSGDVVKRGEEVITIIIADSKRNQWPDYSVAKITPGNGWAATSFMMTADEIKTLVELGFDPNKKDYLYVNHTGSATLISTAPAKSKSLTPFLLAMGAIAGGLLSAAMAPADGVRVQEQVAEIPEEIELPIEEVANAG